MYQFFRRTFMKFKNNLISFFVIAILGSLFHFVYEWSGENYIVGLFFSVNESIWEHLKLIFYPALIFAAGEYLIDKERPENYLCATTAGIFFGMFTTVSLYYIYTGILGFNVDFINITIFLISVIVLIITKTKYIRNEISIFKRSNILCAIILLTTAILFAVWSYNPPSLGIFTPPLIT